MTDAGRDFWSWLAPVLGRKDDDGVFRFSREEAEDFLAIIALAFEISHDESPPVLRRSVEAFLARVEAHGPHPPEDDLPLQIRTYLRAKPLPAELTFELRRGLQEGLVGLSLDAVASAHGFIELLDAATATPPADTDRSQRRGSGALAYFKAKKQL